jgi:predicted O-methyltransferase YrrM
MRWRRKSEDPFLFDSAELLRRDIQSNTTPKQKFQSGNKPVIRWVKGDGLDDPVTKVAIAQATRIFGSAVDYCLCTNGITADRVRDILSWATEPVEWWQADAEDNPGLKELLANSDCFPDRYGYWWKWFPERVRPDAPEWILDGDMVLTATPPWFKKWVSGRDQLRVSQDDRQPHASWWRKPIYRKRSRDFKYGEYSKLVDTKLSLYSGLISLPPKLTYMPAISELLTRQPLKPNHDGVTNMSEQGVIAVAFQTLKPIPIPLNEFPFAHTGTPILEYGKSKRRRKEWGYHFTRSFVAPNPHFQEMVKDGRLFSPTPGAHVDEFRWLAGGSGQWGIPGWGMQEESLVHVLDEAAEFSGKRVLDLGTSRGRIAGSLAKLGCEVTTVDIADRGATQNLAGLNVKVIIEDAKQYLKNSQETFDLVIIDIHGNTSADWKSYGEALLSKVTNKGKIIINNVHLEKVHGWSTETGVSEFLDGLSSEWKIKIYAKPLPGIAVIRRRRFHL